MSATTTHAVPFEVLRGLVHERRTGELIFARDASEVHVFMQKGRIAWGTDTEHPFAFGKQIAVTCGISRDQLGRLVLECRREKTALGEALVRRGLATREQVRAALQHQARLAVSALAKARGGSCEFFERRGFSSYDPELTFELDDLLGRGAELGDPSQLDASRPKAPTTLGAARLAFQAISGCEWAEQWSDHTLLERHAQVDDGLSATLRAHLREADLDFIAVRTRRGATLGGVLSEGGTTLWCGVRDDAPFGAAYAVFARLCDLERRVSHAAPLSRGAGEPRLRIGAGTTLARTAHSLMERASDVLGVCHLMGERTSMLVLRDGAPVMCDARLTLSAAAAFATEGTDGFGSTVVLGESDTWTFGTQLSPLTQESVWLTTGRRVAQGFGWACLTAMARELGA